MGKGSGSEPDGKGATDRGGDVDLVGEADRDPAGLIRSENLSAPNEPDRLATLSWGAEVEGKTGRAWGAELIPGPSADRRV